MKKLITHTLLLISIIIKSQTYEYIKEYSIYTQKPPSSKAEFKKLSDICTDPHGNIFLTDYDNSTIQKFDSSGQFIYIIRYDEVSLPPQPHRFLDKPNAIVSDDQGNLYILDYFERVIKINNEGKLLKMWGGHGSNNGQFISPRQIVTDKKSNIYVADLNYRVQKFDSAGNFLLKFGIRGFENGQFDSFGGMTIDETGNIYVSDSVNSNIQKFDSLGNFLNKWNIKCGSISYYKNDSLLVNVRDTIFTFSMTSGSLNAKIIPSPNAGGTKAFHYDPKYDITVTMHNTDVHFKKYDSSFDLIFANTSEFIPNTFKYIYDFAVDPSKNIYIYSSSLNKLDNPLKKYDYDFNFLFSYPIFTRSTMAVDDSGYVHIGYGGSSRLCSSSNFTKLSPSGSLVYEELYKADSTLNFGNPQAISFDTSNNVYVIDAQASCQPRATIFKLNADGHFLRTRWEYQDDDPYTFKPHSITIDHKNNFYVGFELGIIKYNSEVEPIDTLLGVNGQLAVDKLNNLYVSKNNAVRIFNESGIEVSQINENLNNAGKIIIVDSLLYVMDHGIPQNKVNVYKMTSSLVNSISDDNMQMAYSLTPNPSKDVFVFKHHNFCDVKVYNQLGVEVASYMNTNNLQFGDDLTPGYYLVNINDGKNTERIRIIKY